MIPVQDHGNMISTQGKLCQGGCSSSQFSVKGISYDHIYGKAIAYEKGHVDAFYIASSSIDSKYVDGISITMETPRKHLWTYAVGLGDDNNNTCCNCPCETLPGRLVPSFVGNDYYWEPGITNQTHSP